MALSTWTELKAALADHLTRDNLTDQIPDFIRLAEVDVTARFREGGGVRQMICRAQAVIDEEYEGVPANYAGVKAMSIISTDPDQPLIFVDAAELRDLKGSDPTPGKPTRYCIIGPEFQFFPAPDQAYTVELIVFENIPTLGVSRATNWLLDRFPNVYLYGALTQAALYLGSDPRLSDWSAAYGSAVEAVRRLDLMEQTGNRPTGRIRRFG